MYVFGGIYTGFFATPLAVKVVHLLFHNDWCQPCWQSAHRAWLMALLMDGLWLFGMELVLELDGGIGKVGII